MAQSSQKKNVDEQTVAAFDDQWRVLKDRAGDSKDKEQLYLFERFFSIFPKDHLNKKAKGYEIGCGIGRFAQFVAPQVEYLTLVDASPRAIAASKERLKAFNNCTYINVPVNDLELSENSMDFGYSYGVLHHILDTPHALSASLKPLKKGAPFLIYMYYRFDNRPFWFYAVWWFSNILRVVIVKFPMKLRHITCDILAGVLYWPLARLARLVEQIGLPAHHIPLHDFKNSSFRRMRNNSRDRFGTPLEQRFTRIEMKEMMENAGLKNVSFREGAPYWCAIGYKS